jgi:PhnB protein
MKLYPSILLKGNAESAVQLYAKVFDAHIQIVKFADMPGYPSDGVDSQRVARAFVTNDDFVLAIRDVQSKQDSSLGENGNIMITLNYQDAKQAQDVFEGLSQDAKKIQVPFGKTFFAQGFGILYDKFNIGWEIAGGLQQKS